MKIPTTIIMYYADWLLLMLLFAGLVMADDLTGGQCHTYDVCSISPANVTTIISTNVCCVQQSINYTNIVNTNLTLEPGGRILSGSQNCNYDVQCSSCPSEPDTECKRTRTLEPGEVYSLDDGVCDLKFTCDEDKTPSDWITQEVLISIRKDNETLQIRSLNQTWEKSINYTTVSDELIVQVDCPAFGDGDTTANLDFIESNCRRWIDRFEDRNIVAWELYADLSRDVMGDALNYSSNVVISSDRFREQMISCMSQLGNETALQGQLTLQEFKINGMENTIKDQDTDIKTLVIMLAVTFCFLVACLAWMLSNGFLTNEGVQE